MTEPGWYHGEGDPAGTVRYWDGRTWVGEPTMNASASGVIYYAAVTEETHVGRVGGDPGASAAEYRTTSTAISTPIQVPVPVPTPAIPASAQLIAIGLSALKTVPLAFMALNTILIALFGSIGLGFAYNEDVETLLALAVGISLLTIAIGLALVATQALGAARNNPVLLLVPALVMTLIDGFLTYGSWTNDHSTDHFFYTLLFLAQGWVLIGAIIGMAKKTVLPT